MVDPVDGHVSAADLSAELGGVTIIGTSANSGYSYSGFYGCTELQSIEIPDTVEKIGQYAFYGTTALTSITLPDSVTTIGNAAFFNSGLTSVTLPDGLTKIAGIAFHRSALTSVTIPSSVTEIGQSAFWKATDLTSVDFSNATALKTIGNNAFDSTGVVSVDLSGATALETITYQAFYDATKLTSITLPHGLKEIENQAFKNTNLTSVTILACIQLGTDVFPSTTTVVKSFSRGCLDSYVAEGITYAQIASALTPEELKAAYRAKGNCPT
jgi:aspartokinase-like uncharacterized kinase